VEHLSQKLQQKSRKLSKKLTKLGPSFLLLTLGVILLVYGGVNYYRVRILSFNTAPQASQAQAQGQIPTEITIPSIGVEMPLDVGEIKNGVWSISYDKPTFLGSSARPGGSGNTVIYGHNKKTIFGNLPYLSIGQKIYVKTIDGKIHIYEAYKKEFVAPSRVDLVSPTNTEELTIYTCWGLFDSQRVVIKAKPL